MVVICRKIIKREHTMETDKALTSAFYINSAKVTNVSNSI